MAPTLAVAGSLLRPTHIEDCALHQPEQRRRNRTRSNLVNAFPSTPLSWLTIDALPVDRGLPHALSQDLRFGARRLRNTPLFTVAVLATLSTAIAANVAVFSAVKATLLRPLAIRQPDRVVVVSETAVGAGQNVKEVWVAGTSSTGVH